MWWHSSLKTQPDSDEGNSGSVSIAIQDESTNTMSQTEVSEVEESAAWKHVKYHDLNDAHPCLHHNTKLQNKTVRLKDDDNIKTTPPHDKPADDGLSVMSSSKGAVLAASPSFTESPSTNCLQFDEPQPHGNIIICAYNARPVADVISIMDASVVQMEIDNNPIINTLQMAHDNGSIPVAVPYSKKQSRLLRQRWFLWLSFILAVAILVTVIVGVLIAIGVFPRTKATDSSLSQSSPRPPSLPPSYRQSHAPSVLAPLTYAPVLPELVTIAPSPKRDLLHSTLVPYTVALGSPGDACRVPTTHKRPKRCTEKSAAPTSV